MAKWTVNIPQGRWMAGANHFRTKERALSFIHRWNQVEVNAGNDSVTFEKNGFEFHSTEPDWQLIEPGVMGRLHVSVYRATVHGLTTYRAFDRKTGEPLRSHDGSFVESGSYSDLTAQLFTPVLA